MWTDRANTTSTFGKCFRPLVHFNFGKQAVPPSSDTADIWLCLRCMFEQCCSETYLRGKDGGLWPIPFQTMNLGQISHKTQYVQELRTSIHPTRIMNTTRSGIRYQFRQTAVVGLGDFTGFNLPALDRQVKLTKSSKNQASKKFRAAKFDRRKRTFLCSTTAAQCSSHH